MASFARTIKSPYLSPRIRPSMPGRSMSTNSDQANPPQSPRSGEIIGEFDLSGRNTPAIPPQRPSELQDGFFDLDDIEPRTSYFSVSDLNLLAAGRRGYPPADDPGRRRAVLNPAAGIASCKKLRGETPIDLPQIRRFTSAPARTPPEPLSARGDLPGGYFPLHEDPNSRVHRPHPFQHHPDTRMSRLISESGPIYADSPTSHPAQSVVMSHSNTPVASYLAPGFHDHPVPMGKYYPSNYESRNGAQSNLRPPLSGSVSSNVGSDSSAIPNASSLSKQETELRRKLLQYQRDMVTQTSMAANELISSSAKSGDKPGLSLKDLPFRDSRFATPGCQKPLSPRLLPIGSPGPVTPISLENVGNGDYMSR
ncbi:hypothetical protein BFJ72_g11697 [Fusarium proliferatum]|uniref:Uncharacterized protein n=1 Tax=Gibberella intermedia TaxID=948311 RepID=A0A420SLK1_GIBIN|nr:hypothetical protein BFJ72_g11697 [Fusarium proliferatum]